jgi:hypothetical protein
VRLVAALAVVLLVALTLAARWCWRGLTATLDALEALGREP